MNTRHLLALTAALLAALLLFGCKARTPDNSGPPERYETTSLAVSVGDGSSAPQLNALFVGTFADVTRVTMEVAGEDKFGVPQNPLATATLTKGVDGVWRGTIPDLPIGPTLTFTAHGFDDVGTEIFNGATSQALTGSGDLVAVAMDPVDDLVAIVFPIVEAITLPAEIVHDTSAQASVDVRGSSNETLDYTFASGGGTFAPPGGSLLLPSGGTGRFNTQYTAPPAVGTYLHSVRVTNSQGNAVETDFPTTVVYAVTTPDVTVSFAPVVSALLGKRTGNDVTWTATVSDDGPLAALTYGWSFTPAVGSPAAAYSVANANPGVMSGYDQTVTGEVTFTVTDGNGGGLTTQVSFTLVPGQFPDNVVGTPALGPFAYVSNAFNESVTVIDTASNQVVATIPAGTGPEGLAVTPDGSRVYVANVNVFSNRVTVIAAATNTVATTITLGAGPIDVAISPDGTIAYVTNHDSDSLSFVDTTTNTQIAAIPVANAPNGVALSPNGSRAYVASALNSNLVSVIDTASRTVITTIPVGSLPNRLAVTPDGTRVYVANTGSNNVSVISTATNTVVATVLVADKPNGVAVTPDGSRVWVSNSGLAGNRVFVIDVATNTVIATIPVTAPFGIAFSADGIRAYVASLIGSVAVVDPATNSIVGTIPVPSAKWIAIGP